MDRGPRNARPVYVPESPERESTGARSAARTCLAGHPSPLHGTTV
jgi:hypothetical protein